MWQSIPRTGSLLLRAPRPHSIQRFPCCLLSSLHALLPALSGLPAASSPPSMPRSLRPAFPRCLLSSHQATLPASSGFPAACSPPSMPRPLHPAVYPQPPLSSLHASLPASSVSPLPPLSSLHVALPASSGFPAVPLSPRPRVTPTKAQQNLLTT